MSEKQSARSSGGVSTYEVTDNQTPSEGVVAAVARISNDKPNTLDPLAETIDPDALDSLFADKYDGTPRSYGSVRFSFAGYDVEVTNGELVSVVASSR